MRFSFVAAAAGVLLSVGVAHAAPADFPDVTSYPAVDRAGYARIGGHPSASGWVFSTPAGLRCQMSMIAELGVSCSGPKTSVSVSLTKPAQLGPPEATGDEGPYPLLPTNFKIDTGNGVVCAVPDEGTLACLAAKPASWPADMPDPPDKQYGEHGFVLGPDRSQVF